MSFAEDFGHNIPDDEWGGGYSSRRPRYSYRSSSSNVGSMMVLRSFVKIHHETDKAYLFEMGQGKTWIPKSKVKYLDLNKCQFMIPMWLSQSLTYIKD